MCRRIGLLIYNPESVLKVHRFGGLLMMTLLRCKHGRCAQANNIMRAYSRLKRFVTMHFNRFPLSLKAWASAREKYSMLWEFYVVGFGTSSKDSALCKFSTRTFILELILELFSVHMPMHAAQRSPLASC